MERMVPIVALLIRITCVLAAPLDVVEVSLIDYDRPAVSNPNNVGMVFTDSGTIIIDDMELDLNRNAVANSESHWPNGQVPYVINNTYSTTVHDLIIAAMRELEHDVNGPATCIKFVPRTTQANYIQITSGKGCHSAVGNMNKGKQEVSIGPGCLEKGTIMHELIHSLGFNHEHERTDRDSYININLPNVVEEYKFAFAVSNAARVTNQNTAYDFNSIMHYGPYYFSIDHTKPVISAKPGKAPPNARLGQRVSLSPTDVLEIQRLYRCHEGTPRWNMPISLALEDFGGGRFVGSIII